MYTRKLAITKTGPGLLILRDAQLKVFGEAQRRRFLRRAASHLVRHFPRAAAMPPEELRGFVERSAATLEQRGFTAQNDLVKLLGVLLLLGEDLFETQPWAQRIAESDAGPTLKANRIQHRALGELKRAEATKQ